jgi:hypothetical protein
MLRLDVDKDDLSPADNPACLRVLTWTKTVMGFSAWAFPNDDPCDRD